MIKVYKNSLNIEIHHFYEKVQINPFEIMKKYPLFPGAYYQYEGSLTTPPCSEVVNWYMIAKPLSIKSSQASFFLELWASNNNFVDGRGNNRKIQDLNGRQIKRIIVD